MSGNPRFLYCNTCKNMMGFIRDSTITPVCCGVKMMELVPNTVEASVEKHLPDLAVSGNSMSVAIGSAPHPMEEAHYIPFVYVQTEHGGQRKRLTPGAAPKAEFSFMGDTPIAAYAYCNLHGLWKTEVK